MFSPALEYSEEFADDPAWQDANVLNLLPNDHFLVALLFSAHGILDIPISWLATKLNI